MTTAGAGRSLYRQLLKESRKFSQYNFREYFSTRVREEFRGDVGKPAWVKTDADKLSWGRSQLELLRRQAAIGELYDSPRLVLETKR